MEKSTHKRASGLEQAVVGGAGLTGLVAAARFRTNIMETAREGRRVGAAARAGLAVAVPVALGAGALVGGVAVVDAARRIAKGKGSATEVGALAAGGAAGYGVARVGGPMIERAAAAAARDNVISRARATHNRMIADAARRGDSGSARWHRQQLGMVGERAKTARPELMRAGARMGRVGAIFAGIGLGAAVYGAMTSPPKQSGGRGYMDGQAEARAARAEKPAAARSRPTRRSGSGRGAARSSFTTADGRTIQATAAQAAAYQKRRR